MENSTKNKLASFGAHTLFLTCAGALLLFISSAGVYLEKIKKSVFITAYSDARKTSELEKLKRGIEEMEGVRKTAVLDKNEVFAAVESALARKDVLGTVKSIEIPSVIKIYPDSLDYDNFTRLTARVEEMDGVKASDSGGTAVKKLFVFAAAFQKTVNLIAALLILAALGAALTAAESMKYISERLRFLSERKRPAKEILLSCASEMLIIPLSSLTASVLILLAFYETGEGAVSFLNPAQALLLLILSLLPAAAKLVKSA